MEIDFDHRILLNELKEKFPQFRNDLENFCQIEIWSRDHRQRLINYFVENLIENDSFSSNYSFELQKTFPRYFFSFVHRLFSAVTVTKKSFQQISLKQRFLVLLAELIVDFPTLKTLTETHLISNEVSLIDWKDENSKKKLLTRTNDFDREKFSLFIATLRLFLFSTIHLDEISTWNWNKFNEIAQTSTNESIRWLAFLCFALATKISFEQFDSFRSKISLTTILQISDSIRPRRKFSLNDQSKFDRLFVEEDFRKRTIFIDGFPLGKFSNEKRPTTIRLTRTETIENSLKNLSMAVAFNWPTLISGRISNGKTLIVEYLAEQMSKRLIKIQCSDQMDSKVLVGTYQCTDQPGEFIWTPGLFVEATIEGHWLLMEDIDAATSDVLSLIKTLIDTKSIGHGRISPEFRLFLTYRDTNVPMQSNELIHLLKDLFCVVICPYKDEEILQIMENLPIWNDELKLFQMKFFEFYRKFSIESSKNSSTRLVTLRDLLKCCRRLSTLNFSRPTDRQLALNDVIDCFVAFQSKSSRVQHLQTIGTLFNLNQNEVEYFSMKFTPELNENIRNQFSIGQIQLKIDEKHRSNVDQQTCFAKTRTTLYLLERLARCVQMNEPILLSGETGGGKTTLVQYLAAKTGNHLHVINLSQQSDAVDLLGGYKPFDSILLIKQIYQEFLLEQTNRNSIDEVQKSILAKRYKESLKLMIKYTEKSSSLRSRLIKLRQSFRTKKNSSLLFRFVEGSLVEALKNGHWILLDEINLASAETLQLLNGILENDQGTIWLAERGDKKAIFRHENFRLFGCMNPASDVGKRDIPIGIRNRFTEFFVDECQDRDEILIIVEKYLRQTNVPKEFLDRIVEFYFQIQNKVKNYQLTSSTTRTNRISITYSLRTLCRALKYIQTTQWTGKTSFRAIFEGFSLSFFSQLDRSFYHDVEKLIHQIILGGKPSIEILLKTSEMTTTNNEKFLKIKSFLVLRGEETIYENPNYIFTPTVEENLLNIVRVLSAKSYPILLQGETSVGKTSLIQYLASATGNKCVRINNHEHTDLSEYLGTYSCSASTGQLVFRDGPLIKAMRFGWWIILDELNLASSDILEALNRLLDDNRQLFLSETNELIVAHERFQLFATQNPAGEQYAGRKKLSRAFRNRFIELNFENLPENELETIIEKSCQLPKSYSKLLIKTMNDLQKHRSQKGIFAGKSSLITLRDLFRWAQRYKKSDEKCDNFKQFLGEHGFLLLAGRSRSDDDRKLIKDILEKYFCEKNSSIDEEILFGPSGSPFSTRTIWNEIREKNSFEHIVWTQPLRRLAILTGLAVRFDEPTLLVGETGCGKTTICQILSKINEQKLYTINCHTTTESSDFLGSIRPIRDETKSKGLFEWQDGPLVCSMKEGAMFLIDEISLADDSVLERLNSVLEPEKQLILAEKGFENDSEQIERIQSEEKFRLIATMNPGGDFGKKELSPALRNRFTEIWATPSETIEDFSLICQQNLRIDDIESKMKCSNWICDFLDYLRQNRSTTKRILITVRDLLSWISFINVSLPNWIDGFAEGASLVFLDAIENCSPLKILLNEFISKQIENETRRISSNFQLEIRSSRLHLSSYSIELGPNSPQDSNDYNFSAPTTLENVYRLLRAMQLETKPILIEGAPGVGKTSLVMSLALLSGHSFIRINLSEQTDIADLFGSDLPSETTGKFIWKDGPLLTAIKTNQWIILDELNLANQSVLEGLNACFDHRGEIFIPELNRTFFISEPNRRQTLRIFACQNPYGQTGGRKGLPKSFLNRFTTIFFSNLQRQDFQMISSKVFPTISTEIFEKIFDFHEKIVEEFRHDWEFNLRDLFKWFQIVENDSTKKFRAFELIYAKRMRKFDDEKKIEEIFRRTTGWTNENVVDRREFFVNSNIFRLDSNEIRRENVQLTSKSKRLILMRSQMSTISLIFECLKYSWPILLVGSTSKSSLIDILASFCGKKLERFPLDSSIDASDFFGNFEKSSDGKQFVWIESILIRSMRRGDWIVLENVNRCSISVLDRLNSLLESRRELILTEGFGENSSIVAHRDFRLFLTFDPQRGNGEISRPMRNRCCEIFVSFDLEQIEFDLNEYFPLSNDVVRLHRKLDEKFSNFSLANFFRSVDIFRQNVDIRRAMKISYRTLNSKQNDEIDRLIDEFPLKIDEKNSKISTIFIDDLVFRPEIVLTEKFHQQLWSSSSNEDFRRFQILFYRFVENIRFGQFETEFFREKKPDEQLFIDNLTKKPFLSIRLGIESNFVQLKTFQIDLSSNEKENFDEFEFYRSWRFFVLASRRNDDHLIVLWPQIRHLFVRTNEFQRLDEHFSSIHHDFQRFYENYRRTSFPPFETEKNFVEISRRNSIFRQIDLFQSNHLEKSLEFWSQNDSILGQWLDDEFSHFDDFETLWSNFRFDSTSIDKEKVFVENFRSIFFFRYEWIRIYLDRDASNRRVETNSLKIPLAKFFHRDEIFSQLVFLTEFSPIENDFRRQFADPNSTLIRFFNRKIRRHSSFGLVERIRRDEKFFSKFFSLNAQFLTSNRRNFRISTNFQQFLDEKFQILEQIRPNGQIDPIFYEKILRQIRNEFRREIRDEFDLRKFCDDQNEIFPHSSSNFQWRKPIERFIDENPEENKEIFRFSNEIFRKIVKIFDFQLFENLLKKNFLFEEFFVKKNRKSYDQWRRNVVEFYRWTKTDGEASIFRDVTTKIFDEVFQIVFQFDLFFFDLENSSKTKILPSSNDFLDLAEQIFSRLEIFSSKFDENRILTFICQLVVVFHQISRSKPTKFVSKLFERIFEMKKPSELGDEQPKQDEEDEDEEFRRYFPIFDEFSSENVENEEKTTTTTNDVEVKKTFFFFESFRSIVEPTNLSLNETFPRLLNTIYEFEENSTFLDDFLDLSRPIVENLDEFVEKREKPFDIYLDSNSTKVLELVPVIEMIEKRTNFLLIQHENQPILLEIRRILKKLRSFSISTSLIQFLIGFDFLHGQIHLWQENFASRTLQTTFDDELKILIEKIFEIRRRENENFSQSFSMIEFRQRKETIERFVPILFEIFNSKENDENLDESLEKFFRTSSCGDFRFRVEISKIFSKFFPQRRNLSSLTFFYSQFVEHFQSSIEQRRKPIENDLKEFLRIQKWKDENFYSMKNSIEKCRKFLFKSMKKFKKILDESSTKTFATFDVEKRRKNSKIFPKLDDEKSSTTKRRILTEIFQNLTSKGFSFRRFSTLKSRRKFSPIDFLGDLNVEFVFLQIQNEIFETILTTKPKVDAIVFERIRGFTKNSFQLVENQKKFFEKFFQIFEIFRQKLFFASKIDFSTRRRANLMKFDDLKRQTIGLIEKMTFLQEIFDAVRREKNENSSNVFRYEDKTPKFFDLIDSKEFRDVFDKIRHDFDEILTKLNEFDQHRLVRHRQTFEIELFQRQIGENLPKIEQIFNEIFLDDSTFFNEEIRHFLQMFHRFSSIEIVEEDKTTTNENSTKILKKIRRFRKVLREIFSDEQKNSTSVWKKFEFYVKIFQQSDFERFVRDVEVRPDNFDQLERIRTKIEEIFRRFVNFHRSSIEICFSLQTMFIKLLNEGLEMPKEGEEEENNDEEQKDEGGISGMDDGNVGQNAKDVSEEIETEDQLEKTNLPDEKENEENQNEEENSVENEENGIEVSFDFDGKLDDVENQGENDDQDDENDDEDDEDNVEDQMGDVDDEDQGEIFDDEKWKNEDENQEEKKPNESDEAQGKKQEKEENFAAKEQNLDLMDENDEDRPATPQPTVEKGNENNENENENEENLPDLEFPSDLNLDGGEEKDDEEEKEENPMENEMIEDRPEDEISDQKNTKDQSNYNLDENPDEEMEEKGPDEESALTKDQKSAAETTTTQEEKDQLKNPFANAETFEKEKNLSNETIGESTSKKTHEENEQISSTNERQSQINENRKNPSENSAEKSQTNENRTLSEILEKLDEKLRAALDLNENLDENAQDKMDESVENDPNENPMFAHAKNLLDKSTKQIVDSATENQREENSIENEKDQNESMRIDEEDKPIEKPMEKSKEKENLTKKPKNSSSKTKNSEEKLEEKAEEMSIDEREFVSTSTVEQKFDFVTNVQPNLTEQIEFELEEFYTKLDDEEKSESIDGETLWTQLESLTQPFVFELCEQLRLLLEPTQRTKYLGDFRTGKRLNMKRIIPYVASDFRKDRIWLRRQKPSKRQYQLILAIDDSQSMDNLQVKRLALESLILLGQTLTLLDIGQFGIVSFGEFIRTLQPLSQTLNHQNGIEILKQLKFNQTKTLLAELMESVTFTFSQEKRPNGNLFSQLLIILSDGRGLTVSGKDRLVKSVRHAMAQNIFVVFIILDNINHDKSTSIFQINEAVFLGEKVEFRSYLESFPFPYYLVIQNLEMLPRALIDVLRQFLEMTTANQHNHQ